LKRFLTTGLLFLVSSIISGFSFLPNLAEKVKLNDQAIQITNILIKENNNSPINSFIIGKDLELDCHLQWLNLRLKLFTNDIEPHLGAIESVMKCSPLHTNFIRNLAPGDMHLAETATILYPDNPGFLFWLVDGLKEESPEQAEILFRKIVEIDPDNGIAWHQLALLTQSRGNIDDAIIYNVNSCINHDPGKNGCYGAARLLEQQGHYKEAIYYYRFSTWDFSKEQAVRLEQELNNK